MAPKLLSRLLQVLQRNKAARSSSESLSASAQEMRFGIDSLINGRYRLEAEIGRGGMGIVYRAHDIPNDRDVAVKVIDPVQANALTRQQFLQEAEINARLHHPHMIPVYETGIVDSGMPEPLTFIVMEWVQGVSLDKTHRLTYTKIIDIGKQICEVLQYVHNEGFVYHDLKPANILLEKRGFHYFVKLMDFGLARPRGMAYLSSESSLAGSFFYLAPELIAGQPADVASDLYALGATLYEMITGRVPFSDFDERTILSQHLEASVPPPSHSRGDVPPALEAIVLRLLVKKPEDRFASAQEVRDALEQIKFAGESGVEHGNLPSLSSPFVDHKSELAQVKELLESNRLVTILGNSEKLMLAIGDQLANQFFDGVWWVELTSVNDPSLVLQTVTSILGVHPDPGRSLSVLLIEHLREKNLLLLLNGVEHALNACAQLAETLLSTCPDLYIMATSAQPLNISAEKLFHAAL